ncbi:twin-arginine translocase TatA/TatE family subunit [Microbispora cellulosiformans]|uniref:Sec-independent protein translocase protein TatA n=1 Tax=Microbispora cellulosiformans TaxID=2614688 RepID=A0A5J5K021_9ACTN|nr:Sec-independent protein translocase subunit TatA [Microbispora cellulosiformans]KAA9377573.1 twin-arginine translocase TatA/TatE family subunit [Microbispora cellulosiformans]
MPNLGPMEWILILLVLILLFGAKKLPDTAKALGQSLRLFKKETSKLSDEDEAKQATVRAEAETVAPPPAQIPPATPSVEERLRALEEENRKLRETQQPVSSQNEPRSN